MAEPLQAATSFRYERIRSQTMTARTIVLGDPMFPVWWAPVIGPTGATLIHNLAQCGEPGRVYGLPELAKLVGVPATNSDRRGRNPITNGIVRAAKFIPEVSFSLEHGSETAGVVSVPFVCSMPSSASQARNWGNVTREVYEQWAN